MGILTVEEIFNLLMTSHSDRPIVVMVELSLSDVFAVTQDFDSRAVTVSDSKAFADGSESIGSP